MGTDNFTKEIIDIAKTIHAKGWTANHEGNITVKISSTRYMATPTAMSKRLLETSDLIIIDAQRNVIEGKRKVFSEIGIHMAVYAQRGDVGAVLHAHPPYATVLSICNSPITRPLTPEFAVSIGKEVPIVEFALHNSPALENRISKYVKEHDVLLLANHGVLSFGQNLEEAYLRMEHVESEAQLQFLSKMHGRAKYLDDSVSDECSKMREKAGLGPKAREAKEKAKDRKGSDIDDSIRKLVKKELLKYTS